jgi:hypothetical protein
MKAFDLLMGPKQEYEKLRQVCWRWNWKAGPEMAYCANGEEERWFSVAAVDVDFLLTVKHAQCYLMQ